MWKRIIDKFNRYPAQQKVVQKLVQLGLRIGEDKKIYCLDVEINIVSLAKSINTDRRVVKSTIYTILADNELKEVFLNITPSGPLLTNISNHLNLGIIELEGSAERPGIISKVTSLLADNKISIRQAYASDPELDSIPHITVVTDQPINGNLLKSLLKIEGISRVSIR